MWESGGPVWGCGTVLRIPSSFVRLRFVGEYHRFCPFLRGKARYIGDYMGVESGNNSPEQRE